jgi:response regulator of citrate/malate metabolism
MNTEVVQNTLPADAMYQLCPACGGTRRIDTENRGTIECPSCKPVNVVQVGLTLQQVDRFRHQFAVATSVVDQLIDACRAADHAIGSVMAVRDGISDELLQEVREALQAAMQRGPLDRL